MVAAVEWTSLTVASAFVLGAVGGTVATIAVMRSLTRFLDRRDRE